MRRTYTSNVRIPFCPALLITPAPKTPKEREILEGGTIRTILLLLYYRDIISNKNKGFSQFHFVPKVVGQNHFVPGQNQAVLFCPLGQNKSPWDKMKLAKGNLGKMAKECF